MLKNTEVRFWGRRFWGRATATCWKLQKRGRKTALFRP